MDDHSPKKLEYNYITDGVYIGTNQCCKTHFDKRLLEKDDITVDISLEGERIDLPYGVDWYAWIPIKDKTAPTQDKLEFVVAAIEKSIALGKKIYLHCKNGHGRAPTVFAAYLVKNKGMTPDEAVEFIRSKRPTIHLEETQKEAIIDFYKKGRR